MELSKRAIKAADAEKNLRHRRGSPSRSDLGTEREELRDGWSPEREKGKRH